MRLYISTYWFFCPYVCDGFFLRLCLCFDDDSITRREFGHVYTYMCDNCSVHICVNHCLSHVSLYSRLALRFRNLCVASPHFKVMSYVLKPPAVIARQSAHELSHDEVVNKWCIAGVNPNPVLVTLTLNNSLFGTTNSSSMSCHPLPENRLPRSIQRGRKTRFHHCGLELSFIWASGQYLEWAPFACRGSHVIRPQFDEVFRRQTIDRFTKQQQQHQRQQQQKRTHCIQCREQNRPSQHALVWLRSATCESSAVLS